jgi:hypothetical protein
MRSSSAARNVLVVATVAVVVAVVLGAAAPAPARTRQLRQVLDVVTCPTEFGAGPETLPSPPARLPVAVSKRVARQLAFYSNGRITMLAPKGWSCAGLVAADGSEQLQAYPKGKVPEPGGKVGEAVLVVADSTGHGPGAQLVCPYFPDSAAAHFFGPEGPACPALPEGRIVRHETDDVATFTDPVGTQGEVIYPQVASEPSPGVPVTYAECTIRGARRALCTPILDDVLTRRPPVASVSVG